MTQEEIQWLATTIHQRYIVVEDARIPKIKREAMLKGMDLLISDIHRQCVLDLSISVQDWKLACTKGRVLYGEGKTIRVE